MIQVIVGGRPAAATERALPVDCRALLEQLQTSGAGLDGLERALLREAVDRVLEAFRGSVCAAAGMIEPPEAVIRVVNDEINRAAERHAGASLAALTGGLPPEETWLARADAEAKAELSAVSKLILDFAGKEVQP